MALKRFVALNNGLRIPQIGFGTWQSRPGEFEECMMPPMPSELDTNTSTALVFTRTSPRLLLNQAD
ncbi:hypothetical protein J007_04144 [Cryptococcus neoformans]|nr:hypothetical protein J007_04144 [Cryptococcus neoformans var. grubii]OXC60281.1 hypothetical protein C358_04257 [Cryptococcus neoformans var. grubii MW-RSA852]